MKKISYVIPCYRSEDCIESVVRGIAETQAADGRYEYEIILVNDCSPDGVFSVIARLASSDSRIKAIDLARNFGQHAALMAGFHHVSGDVVVCIDDDGQNPPQEAFSLIDALGDDCDLVFAKYTKKKHSLFRNLGSRVNDLMARWLIGKPKELTVMSYFACKRFVCDEVIKYTNPYPYVSGLLLRATKRAKNVEITHRKRKSGVSGYTMRKLISLWLNGFTAFSVKPLRIATLIGCVTAVLGFAYGIYIIINKLINPAAPLGYSSTMAVLLFLGGMLMLMLGLIGEYIGRIYIGLNNSPQYVIRSTINIKDEKSSE